MNSHISFVSNSISLKNLTFKHQPYIIRYPVPSSEAAQEQLVCSIKQHGLLSPIILQKGQAGELFIVHGSRRAQACRVMGYHSIDAKIITRSQPYSDVYQLSLSIFLAHQKPNIIEQARIIHNLGKFLPEETIIQKFLPRIGLTPNQKVFWRISQLAELEEEITQDVALGRANSQLAWRLLKLPPSARLPMYRYLNQLSLSLSQQFEVLEYIQEISRRDLSSIADLLKQPEILNTDLEQRQKAQAVRLFWRARRYPRLTAVEEEFVQSKKALRLPEHLELYPPQNFEHGSYKFELKFADLSELQQKLDFLNALVKADKLKHTIKS